MLFLRSLLRLEVSCRRCEPFNANIAHVCISAHFSWRDCPQFTAVWLEHDCLLGCSSQYLFYYYLDCTSTQLLFGVILDLIKVWSHFIGMETAAAVASWCHFLLWDWVIMFCCCLGQSQVTTSSFSKEPTYSDTPDSCCLCVSVCVCPLVVQLHSEIRLHHLGSPPHSVHLSLRLSFTPSS